MHWGHCRNVGSSNPTLTSSRIASTVNEPKLFTVAFRYFVWYPVVPRSVMEEDIMAGSKRHGMIDPKYVPPRSTKENRRKRQKLIDANRVLIRELQARLKDTPA